jgi:D-3-phosphoglycerate dehydrogenase
MKLAVLDDYQRVALTLADWSRVQAACEITVFDRNFGSVDEAAEALADFDIICTMRERMPIPAELIARLPKLKLIVVTGPYNRTLDVAACEARGIVVSATRSAGTEHPTAELTWALILGAARNLGTELRNVREGGWMATVGTTVFGKTLGVLGLGRLGTEVARLGRAFGMEIIAWSPNLTAEKAEAGGARLVSKAQLFEQADVLTIHVVLSDRSRGLVGAEDLARMKSDAILINTARGPIVDEDALVQVLKAGRIGMAGLDVFGQEPLPADHPFRTLPNVLATPHLGYVTRDTYEVFFQDTVEDVEAFLAGRPIRLLTH